MIGISQNCETVYAWTSVLNLWIQVQSDVNFTPYEILGVLGELLSSSSFL